MRYTKAERQRRWRLFEELAAASRRLSAEDRAELEAWEHAIMTDPVPVLGQSLATSDWPGWRRLLSEESLHELELMQRECGRGRDA